MELYLVRHGEAYSKEESPDRRLTDRGRRAVEETARGLAKEGVRVARIYHSGLTRTRETAEALSEILHAPVDVAESLGPDEPPEKALDLIRDESLMFVGHLPHLPSLASLLMTGNPSKIHLDLKPGGAVCLAKDRSWRLRWVRRPEETPSP